MILRELLVDAAMRTPWGVAVVDRTCSTTYAALDDLADRVAHGLHDRGVGPDDRVGIWLPKSARAIAATQGALRRGAAYVPLDPSASTDALRRHAVDMRLSAIVGSGTGIDALADLDLPFVDPDELPAGPVEPAPRAPPRDDDLACILLDEQRATYLSQRDVLAFVQWAAVAMRATPGDRLSNHVPLHVDLAMLDIYVAFLVGARVCLVPDGQDPRDLVRFVVDQHITIWTSKPSVLNEMMEHGELLDTPTPHLHTVVVAGEPETTRRLRRLVESRPGLRLLDVPNPTREPPPPGDATVASADLQPQLMRFVVEELLDGDDRELTPQTPLLEWGVLDSMSMLALLAYIEQDLGIEVPNELVRPESFQDVEQLGQLLATLSRTATPPGTVRATPASVISRAANASQGIATKRVRLASGAIRDVAFAPGPRPGWLLIPGPFNPSVSWGAILRRQLGVAATWAPTLLGLGPDDDGQRLVSFGEQLEATFELVERLDDAPLVLLGNGLGGAIATEIARRLPDRVAALVVVAWGRFDRPFSWWRHVVSLSASPATYLDKAFFQPPSVPIALLERMEAVLGSAAYRDFLTEADAEVLERQFDALRVPTLFVGGSRDELVPQTVIEAAARRVPGSRIEMLARCGHLVHVERAHELLAIVRGFVATLPPVEVA